MKCQHIDETNSGQAIHTLPCRDSLCMQCLFGISDLFKGNPFSCPLCGKHTQYKDAMIQSIKDKANTHRTKQIGQKKEEFTPSRIGEGTEGDQKSDEASEHSGWYNKRTKSDPPVGRASDKNFATRYSPGGISASQQHYRHTYRDHHGGSEQPNLPAVTGIPVHHHHQEELLARCQQNKANSERDFHLNNGRGIPDNYCQSDKGQGTSKADVFCIEHDLSEVYFFCETCSRPVCGKCVNSTHSKHKYLNFESPGETDSEKQSKFYHASLSDASADLSPSNCNRSSDSRQGFHKSSKDEDYPLNMERMDRHEQRELSEQYGQAKHPTHHSKRDFHLNNGRDIPDNYCQSDKGQGTSKADFFCIEHDLSEVYFFCETCSRPVCGKCVNSTHSKHKYLNFESPGETDSEKQSKHEQRELSEQYGQAKHPTHHSKRDFHLNNGRDIPDNYCQSDKGQGTSKADVFCTEHDLSEVYFFCETCSGPVCRKCVNSTHSKHNYFSFESPGETDSEKQSKFYHASLSDASADLSPSNCNRSSDSRQGFHKSSKDEDYPLNMERMDRHEQRELSEQYEQAKRPTNYDTHVSPQTHGYNLRRRSTGACRYSETEVAQVDTVACKGEDRFCKDHPGSEVYLFCRTCDTPACGKCISANHCDHVHDMFGISEDETTNEVMCDVHNLPCTMYCEKCSVIICTSCSKGIKHHWLHETWSLDKDTITNKFIKHVKTLQKNTEECDKLKESTAKGKEKIQKEADELKEKVMKATQLAKEKLDSIAAEHIAKIEDELETCMKPRNDFDVKIVNMKKELKDSEETISTAWQLITDNDLPNAALAEKSVNDSLQKFTKTNLKISQPSGGLGLQFRVNRTPYEPFSVSRPLYSGSTYYRSTFI